MKNSFTKNLIRLNTVDSTNDEAFRIGRECAVTASLQTKGKGRMGRSFTSDSADGLWLSILERKILNPEITAWTAVAVCRVLEKYIPDCRIKWPNDILVSGKKICGILCEQKNGSVVIGIGINLYRTDFKELSEAATSARLCGAEIDRETLLAEILESLDKMLSNYPNKKDFFLDYYRKHCCVTGRKIKLLKAVQRPDESNAELADAIDIDEQFRLIIRNEAGEISALNHGEISIRI